MSQIIYVTGGARSGKSVYAEKRAALFGAPLGYLATAQPLDGEMSERIKRHQERRGAEWSVIEEPLDPAAALKRCDGNYQAILVDCVTLWLTNLLFRYGDAGNSEKLFRTEVERLIVTLEQMVTPVILVSNEVGLGIVPDNSLARLFRDIAGSANQLLAAASNEAYVVVSGIPLQLK